MRFYLLLLALTVVAIAFFVYSKTQTRIWFLGPVLLAVGVTLSVFMGSLYSRQRESEQRYRKLFALNPHPVWVYDRETLCFLAVNKAVVRQDGYSEDKFVSLTIREIRPVEDVPALIKTVTALRDGDHKASGWRHRKKDEALSTWKSRPIH